MSEGGGMPMPVSDLRRKIRNHIATWLDAVEMLRDAKLRSGMLTAQEVDDLCSASVDLRLSWTNFDKFSELLVCRLGEDDLAQRALVMMYTEYRRSTGAAGTMSKLCDMPRLGDFRALKRSEMKRRRGQKQEKPKGKLARSARTIAMELASPLWTQDTEKNGSFRFRGKHTAVADYIYNDFCRRMGILAPSDSHWAPPESDGKGKPLERYRAKMLNAIRAAFSEWENARSLESV